MLIAILSNKDLSCQQISSAMRQLGLNVTLDFGLDQIYDEQSKHLCSVECPC